MATFSERVAHSVYHKFSLYFDFGFEGGTLVLIAPTYGHCLSLTPINNMSLTANRYLYLNAKVSQP